MATVANPGTSAEHRERLFFLIMALAIAFTVVTAFSLFILAGISSFGAPWWVHVHAVSFMAWIGFYVVQNALVFRNGTALHGRLGRVGAVYAIWLVMLGLVLTPLTLAVGRSPPFFTPAYFLALDWANILVFGALLYFAVRLRKRTDWHRRLMLAATVCVMAPALGRLIVLSGMPMTAAVNAALLALYIFAAMAFDRVNRGSVHPAHIWGLGALLSIVLLTELLAALPPFAALAGRIAA